MLRLWAGMAAARVDTGMGVSGLRRASAVRAVITLVRLAGRMGTCWLLPWMTLPGSASTRIHAPGGGTGGGGLGVGAGAAKAPVAGRKTTSNTATRPATTRELRRTMDCRVLSKAP